MPSGSIIGSLRTALTAADELRAPLAVEVGCGHTGEHVENFRKPVKLTQSDSSKRDVCIHQRPAVWDV